MTQIIQLQELEIREMSGPGADLAASAFVRRHHYSRSYPSATARVAALLDDEIVACAVWTTPWAAQVTGAGLGKLAGRTLELSRLVVRDDVEKGAATWLLSRCRGLLASRGWRAALADADPQPRRNASGQIVFAGHAGRVYQYLGARYLGRGSRKTLHLLPDGGILPHRLQGKISRRERGWRSGVRRLVAAGARPLRDGEDTLSWLREVRDALCRRVTHKGNHRYCWALSRGANRWLPQARSEPPSAPDPG